MGNKDKDKDKIIKEFFELKFLQLLTEVLTANYREIAYTQDETDELALFVKYDTLNDEVVEKIHDFVMKYHEELDSYDLHEEVAKVKNKVSMARQKELSKEFVGEEYTTDDIVEIIDGIEGR